MYETNSEDCSGARDHQSVVGDPFSSFSRAQGGDASAIEELVERHRDDVYGFLLQMTRSEVAASELTGQSFLSTHRRLKDFRSEAEYAAWLHRAAAEWALRTCPGGNFELPDHTNPAEYSRSDWSQSAPETALSDELRQAIEEATNRLPPAQRETFLLKDVADLSYEEIAEITHRPLRVIKSCLHQARLRLHQAIDRFYSANDR